MDPEGIQYYLTKRQKNYYSINRNSLYGVPTFVETARKVSSLFMILLVSYDQYYILTLVSTHLFL